MTSVLSHLPPELLAAHEPPCVSLYQPTHRHHPQNEQDQLRYRNLLKTLERSLAQQWPERDAAQLLARFRELEGDREFWNHTLDGLAIFAARGFFHVAKLQQTLRELLVVAESFHLKPLRRVLQSADRFQVLGLDRQRARLFEGNRSRLDEIEPAPGVPRTLTDALGEQVTEPHSTVAAYGGVGRDHGAMHHGHGGRKDEIDVDVERFFRAVDRAVWEHHSKPSGLPLLLAALPEHHGHFRRLSHNPQLLPVGLKLNPDTLSLDQLRDAIWQVLAPQVEARVAALLDEFAVAKSHERGLENLPEIAVAASQGRIGLILVEAERTIPGRIDPATGELEDGASGHAGRDDLLDDLGELVAARGGQVIVLASERMPTHTGAAAIARYPLL